MIVPSKDGRNEADGRRISEGISRQSRLSLTTVWLFTGGRCEVDEVDEVDDGLRMLHDAVAAAVKSTQSVPKKCIPTMWE